MVYGNQIKIVQFLSSLAQGFVQTRLEIQLLFLFLIALLLIFTGYLVVQKASADRQVRKRSRERLEHLLLRLELNAEETTLLGQLARYLDRGRPEYTLLVSRGAFDACADKALLSGDASEAPLSTWNQARPDLWLAGRRWHAGRSRCAPDVPLAIGFTRRMCRRQGHQPGTRTSRSAISTTRSIGPGGGATCRNPCCLSATQ